MSEPNELRITVAEALVCEVQIPDPEPTEGFEPWFDHIRAYWNARDGWWDLSGQNMGAGNGLIVHPYQIDGMIALLTQMKHASPDPSAVSS